MSVIVLIEKNINLEPEIGLTLSQWVGTNLVVCILSLYLGSIPLICWSSQGISTFSVVLVVVYTNCFFLKKATEP